MGDAMPHSGGSCVVAAKNSLWSSRGVWPLLPLGLFLGCAAGAGPGFGHRQLPGELILSSLTAV